MNLPLLPIIPHQCNAQFPIQCFLNERTGKREVWRAGSAKREQDDLNAQAYQMRILGVHTAPTCSG